MLSFDVLGVIHTCEPDNVVIAGFTGRDQKEVRAHMDELEELGISTPISVPTFYAVPSDLLTQDGAVVTVHPDTSGEAEVVLVVNGSEVVVTLGSDHTDRAAEKHDIGLSKGLCSKPISGEAWPLELVAAHLDLLEIRSWIVEGGAEVLYQSGRLSDILSLSELLDRVPLEEGSRTFVLFTGTVPVIGRIRGSRFFRAELRDPTGGRTIALRYEIAVEDGLSQAR